jgi:iron complex transport system permease protein
MPEAVPRSDFPGHAIRIGRGFSLRIGRRPVVVGVALALLVAALLVAAIGTGDFPIAPLDVLAALTGHADAGTSFIVLDLRLPRALCGLLVGVALGTSGAIFQSLTRNPLGSPDIIGFEQGASVRALIVITVLAGSSGAVSAGALAGGAVSALVVYGLAYRRGGTS